MRARPRCVQVTHHLELDRAESGRIQVNSEVIWPWFAALPSLPEPPELLAVLQTLAPEIFEEEE